MRSFCFCPNECNSLHWWAKQKEILYYNEDNLDPCYIRVIHGSCLSLAFPSLIHLAEDIAPHSGVFGLLAEAVHVLLDVLWVDDTCCRSCCNRFESLTVSQFGSTWFASAFAVHSAVVYTRGSAVCKADFVFLGNLAVDFLHRECIFNLCHSDFELRILNFELRVNISHGSLYLLWRSAKA